MKQIIKDYILKILTNNDLSFNEKRNILLNLFLKIKQITYPEEKNTQVYFIHHISKDYNGDYKWDKYISIINILYKELYQDSYSESELLNDLSKEISDRILYNENKLLFNKYI